WNLESSQTSWIATAGFVGMALGATLGGLLADKFGRRHVFALTLLVYGLATGASALATGLGVLIVLRFIVGLGLGAELPVASTLISEFAPRKIRGRMVVLLEAFWAAGWIGAAIVGTFVVESSIWSPRMRARTAALWVIWFCINLSYYGAFIWIPSLLVADGFTLVRSFTFTLIITLAQLPGYAAAAWLIEVWGRRVTLAVF